MANATNTLKVAPYAIHHHTRMLASQLEFFLLMRVFVCLILPVNARTLYAKSDVTNHMHRAIDIKNFYTQSGNQPDNERTHAKNKGTQHIFKCPTPSAFSMTIRISSRRNSHTHNWLRLAGLTQTNLSNDGYVWQFIKWTFMLRRPSLRCHAF